MSALTTPCVLVVADPGRISELSEVLVLADVQESDAYDLRVGEQVTIRTRAGGVVRPGSIDVA